MILQRRKCISFLIVMAVVVLPLALLQEAHATAFQIPNYPNGFWGGVEGTHFVGVIPVQIDTNNDATLDTFIEAYCVTHGVDINTGVTYDAIVTPAPDNQVNSEIGFILTWYHTPGSYSGTSPVYTNSFMTQDQAVSIQKAIWHFTNSFDVSGIPQAKMIADDADGKDIVRAGDTLTLTSISQSPGSATLEAKVTKSDATPRGGVMVLFKMTGVDSVSGLTTPVTEWNAWNDPSGYTDYTYEGLTGSDGKIQFTITYSQSSPLTKVDAFTKGLWPQFLTAHDANGNLVQGLTGVTFGSSVVIKTALFVVPEYALGGLLPLVACFAAFAIYKKRSRSVRLQSRV